MAVSEHDRHELYRSLERAIGEKPTATFMTMLERAARDDWATKRDLAELRLELRLEIQRALRLHLLATAGIIAALNGTLVAALELT